MASSGGATEGSTADSLDCQGGDCKSSRSRPAGLRRAVRFGIPHCLLRTGELLALQFKDLELSTETGVVSLYSSKSGLRTGTEEAVAVRDPLVLELLQTLAVSQKFCPGQKLWPHSAQFFRNRFAEHMRFFRIAHLKMKPYSLRRGGATFLLQQGLPLDVILLPRTLAFLERRASLFRGRIGTRSHICGWTRWIEKGLKIMPINAHLQPLNQGRVRARGTIKFQTQFEQ